MRTYAILEEAQKYGKAWKRADDLDSDYFSDVESITAPFKRMNHGVAIMTDGPLPLFFLDAQTRLDSENLNFDPAARRDF